MNLRYAPAWRRALAAIIDGAVLFVPVRVADWATGRVGIWSVLWLGYFVVLTGLWGQTLGKVAAGIKVVREDGTDPDLPTAALREVLGKMVSGLLFGMGYLWALWDERHQGLHDKIAGTVVVETGASAAEPKALGERPQVIDVREAVRAGVHRVAGAKRAAPRVAMRDAADGTVTIVFADLEGVAELADAAGDLRVRDALRRFVDACAAHVSANEGVLVKSTGDGVLATFRSARRALACATAIVRIDTAEPVRPRVGMHAGEVLREGGDVFGKNVVLASRIASHARGGEILVSSVVRELAEQVGDWSFAGPRSVALKDLAGDYALYSVS